MNCYCEGSDICDICFLREVATMPSVCGTFFPFSDDLMEDMEMAYDSPDDSVTVFVELPDNIEISPSIIEFVEELSNSEQGEC